MTELVRAHRLSRGESGIITAEAEMLRPFFYPTTAWGSTDVQPNRWFRLAVARFSSDGRLTYGNACLGYFTSGAFQDSDTGQYQALGFILPPGKAKSPELRLALETMGIVPSIGPDGTPVWSEYFTTSPNDSWQLIDGLASTYVPNRE